MRGHQVFGDRRWRCIGGDLEVGGRRGFRGGDEGERGFLYFGVFFYERNGGGGGVIIVERKRIYLSSSVF